MTERHTHISDEYLLQAVDRVRIGRGENRSENGTYLAPERAEAGKV
jgi:hypothetical protein